MTKIDSPIKIGSFTLKNRITFAPTVKFDFTDDSGKANDKLIEHYTERAKGGCGLICVEAVAVVPGGAFGSSGEGFVRVSYAYSLDHIMEAAKRIKEFIEELKQ